MGSNPISSSIEPVITMITGFCFVGGRAPYAPAHFAVCRYPQSGGHPRNAPVRFCVYLNVGKSIMSPVFYIKVEFSFSKTNYLLRKKV